MRAGDRNRLIRIQKRAPGVDAAGQPNGAWQDAFPPVRAKILGATGMGTITRPETNVPASVERYSFRIAYRTTVTTDMRVVYSGQAFDIRQIRLDLDKHDWTDLVCELGGNDG